MAVSTVSCSIIKNINRPPPLPSYSFASDGYGIYVNVVTPAGRLIWRPKLFWHETLGKMIDATLRKAKCKNGTIMHNRQTLEKKRKVNEYEIRPNDDLIVMGLDEPPPPTPTPLNSFGSGSFNARVPGSSLPSPATSPRLNSARSGSAGSSRSWLPVGPTNWP